MSEARSIGKTRVYCRNSGYKIHLSSLSVRDASRPIQPLPMTEASTNRKVRVYCRSPDDSRAQRFRLSASCECDAAAVASVLDRHRMSSLATQCGVMMSTCSDDDPYLYTFVEVLQVLEVWLSGDRHFANALLVAHWEDWPNFAQLLRSSGIEYVEVAGSSTSQKVLREALEYHRPCRNAAVLVSQMLHSEIESMAVRLLGEGFDIISRRFDDHVLQSRAAAGSDVLKSVLIVLSRVITDYSYYVDILSTSMETCEETVLRKALLEGMVSRCRSEASEGVDICQRLFIAAVRNGNSDLVRTLLQLPQLRRHLDDVSSVVDEKTGDTALHLTCRIGATLVDATFADDIYIRAIHLVASQESKYNEEQSSIALSSDYYTFITAAFARLDCPPKGLDLWQLHAMSSEMKKLQLNVRFEDYIEIAHLLIKHGADIHATNSNGETPLHVSCALQLCLNESLLEIYGLCRTWVYERNVRWMRNCALMGMVKSLPERKVCDDNRESYFTSLVCDVFPSNTVQLLNPVVRSYFENVTKLIRTLLQAGANVDVVAPVDRTPLVVAVDEASKCVAFCREVCTTASEQVRQRVEKFEQFFRANVFTVVRDLLTHNADWRIGSANGISVLDMAVYSNQTNLLVELVCQGAEVVSWPEYLILVFESEQQRVIEKTLVSLSSLGVSVDTTDEAGLTPLHLAAQRNLPDVVRALIQFGADVAAVDSTGQTAFEIAHERGCSNAALAFQRHLPVKLMTKGGHIDLLDRTGHTALHIAATEDDVHKVRELLISGADVGIADEDGRTPLVSALVYGSWNSARAIIDRGPEVLASSKMDVVVNSVGLTVLHLLCFPAPSVDSSRHIPRDIFRRILGAGGISANVTDFNGNTALHNLRLVPDVCELLVEYGADVNWQNGLGETPLHAAFRAGAVDLVRCLIRRGADLEARDDFFNTPFHCDTSYQSDWKHLLTDLPQSVVQSDVVNVFGARQVFHFMAVDDARPRRDQVDTTYCDHLGNTALHVAAGVYGHKFRHIRLRHCDDDKQQDLFSLTSRADFSTVNSFGQTPLHLKWLDMAFRLERDDSLHQRDGLGRTSWHHMFIFHLVFCPLAVTYMHEDCQITLMDIERELEVLRTFPEVPAGCRSKRSLLNVAGCNDPDYSGRTALHYAAMQTGNCFKCYVVGCYLYCKCCIFMLGIESWAVKDKWGRTPLHYAYLNGHVLPTFVIDILPPELTDTDGNEDSDGYTPNQMLDSYKHYRDNRKVARDIKTSCFGNFQEILRHCCTTEFFKDCVTPTRIDTRTGQRWPAKDATSFVWNIWTQLSYAYRDPDYDTVHAAVIDFMTRLMTAIGEEDKRLKGVLHQVGSSFEGSRIGFPDEFDFNIELVNLSAICRPVMSSECPNGFAHLVKRADVDLSDGGYDQFFDQSGTLVATAVSFWFQTTWIKVLSWQKFWDTEPLFEVADLSRVYKLPPNKLVKNVDLRFNRPINGKILHYSISVDIVPVVRVEGWWPDGTIAVSPRIRAVGCNFVLDQPRRKHGASHSKQQFVRISFARAESMSIRHSPPVVRAAYMVAKHINSRRNDVSSHTLKIAALWSANDTGKLTSISREPPDHLYELDAHQLQQQVEALFRRLWQFCVEDHVPSYFMPSVRVAVWEFELFPKYSHTLLRRTFSDYRKLVCADAESVRHVALHDIREMRQKVRNALACGFALLYAVSDRVSWATDWILPDI